MTKLTKVNYPMLPTKDNGFINKIKNELNDTMAKRQTYSLARQWQANRNWNN